MKYIKCLGINIILFLILNLVITIISYFDLLNLKGVNIIKSIILVITFLISGIYIGKISKSKAYLEGIKISLLFILISLLSILLFKLDFSYKTLLNYLLIIIISILGSIIGINIKKKTKS